MCQLCLDAAVERLRGEGVPPVEGSRLYELVVLKLAQHYYDNRSLLGDKAAPMPEGVLEIVNDLHYAPHVDLEVSADGV